MSIEAAKEELTRQVIELQLEIKGALGQGEPDAWMSLSLTIAQLKSLLFIASERKTNFKKLAAALRVTPSNVTGIIDRLVDQGLVLRRECAEDRRVLILQISEKGRALLNTLRESKENQMYEVLSRLSSEELTHLAQGLRALVKAARIYSDAVAERA